MKTKTFIAGATNAAIVAALVIAASANAKESSTDAKATSPSHSSALHLTPGGWNAPPEYRIDMEVDAEGQHFTMHRFISNGSTRSELKSDGMSFVMLELGDADGTTYTLMPEDKTAIKQTRKGMEAIAAKVSPEVAAKVAPGAGPKTALAPDEAPQPPGNVEKAGRETVDGIECDKLIYTFDGTTSTSWVDAATGRPVRMESAQGKIVWKNYVVGPQKKELFAAPSDYEITDIDAMMTQLDGSGMGGMLSGMMGGGLGGMAQGMAGNMGSSFGAGLGGALGGALGGPLGAMAGQYLGGAVGGMVGKKVAGAVTGN